MQAGRLRHRITLQSSTESKDSFGGASKTWAAVGTVWAAVEPLSGREYFDARQQEASVDTRITVRWRDGVEPKMRVLWTDPSDTAHVYDIVSVITDYTHMRQYVLMCAEVLS